MKRVVALSVFVVFAIPLIWIAGTGLLQPEGHAIGTVRPGQVDDDTGVLDEYDGPEYNDAELIFFGRAAANDEVDSFEFRSPFGCEGGFRASQALVVEDSDDGFETGPVLSRASALGSYQCQVESNGDCVTLRYTASLEVDYVVRLGTASCGTQSCPTDTCREATTCCSYGGSVSSSFSSHTWRLLPVYELDVPAQPYDREIEIVLSVENDTPLQSTYMGDSGRLALSGKPGQSGQGFTVKTGAGIGGLFSLNVSAAGPGEIDEESNVSVLQAGHDGTLIFNVLHLASLADRHRAVCHKDITPGVVSKQFIQFEVCGV